jgi:hypothetical protein
MVRANRWSMAEAVLRPRDVFRAAESDGPQLVVDASGTFIITFKANPGTETAEEYLVKGGTGKREH